MKKPTCTFSPAIQCARRFFYSYLKETKKINNQFLTEPILSLASVFSYNFHTFPVFRRGWDVRPSISENYSFELEKKTYNCRRAL